MDNSFIDGLTADERNVLLRHLLRLARDEYGVALKFVKHPIDDVLPWGTMANFIYKEKNLHKALPFLEDVFYENYKWILELEAPIGDIKALKTYIERIPHVGAEGITDNPNNVDALAQYKKETRDGFLRYIVRYLKDNKGVILANLATYASLSRDTVGNFARGRSGLNPDNLMKLESTVNELYWPLLIELFPIYGTEEFTEYINNM